MFTNACFKLPDKTNKQEKLKLILGNFILEFFFNFIFLYNIAFGNLVPMIDKTFDKAQILQWMFCFVVK
jgi:hypothetical protein